MTEISNINTIPQLPGMQPEEMKFDKSTYVVTHNGNKVSKNNAIFGSQQIVLQGTAIVQEGTMIRGDLGQIKINTGTVIRKNCVIRPPIKHYTKGVAFFPMTIGSYTYIGESSIINSIHIGSYVALLCQEKNTTFFL